MKTLIILGSFLCFSLYAEESVSLTELNQEDFIYQKEKKRWTDLQEKIKEMSFDDENEWSDVAEKFSDFCEILKKKKKVQERCQKFLKNKTWKRDFQGSLEAYREALKNLKKELAEDIDFHGYQIWAALPQRNQLNGLELTHCTQGTESKITQTHALFNSEGEEQCLLEMRCNSPEVLQQQKILCQRSCSDMKKKYNGFLLEDPRFCAPVSFAPEEKVFLDSSFKNFVFQDLKKMLSENIRELNGLKKDFERHFQPLRNLLDEEQEDTFFSLVKKVVIAVKETKAQKALLAFSKSYQDLHAKYFKTIEKTLVSYLSPVEKVSSTEISLEAEEKISVAKVDIVSRIWGYTRPQGCLIKTTYRQDSSPQYHVEYEKYRFCPGSCDKEGGEESDACFASGEDLSLASRYLIENTSS